jgi:hypothetical protein
MVGLIRSKTNKTNIEMGLVIGLIVASTAFISWRWVKGIDYMMKNHPDYKGEDLFDEDLHSDNDVTKTAGRDGWDDNRVHSEGDIW